MQPRIAAFCAAAYQQEAFMTDALLYVLWGGFYIISIVLGFMPEPEGVVRILLMLLGAAVFVPPAVILYRGRKTSQAPRLVRNISIAVLGATMIFMVLNIFSVLWTEFVGDLLYYLLAVVSAPMLCMQYKALGLFGWACLLMTALEVLRQQKKQEN